MEVMKRVVGKRRRGGGLPIPLLQWAPGSPGSRRWSSLFWVIKIK